MERNPSIPTIPTREPESFPNLDTALQLAEELVFADAIDPRIFMRSNGGQYADSHVEEDLKYVERREQRFKEKNFEEGPLGHRAELEAKAKIARVFEGMILYNGDQNFWLGKDTQMIVPSRFDDIKNGIDGIAELHKDGMFAHIALGIDVTSSVNNLGEKLVDIKDKIMQGQGKLAYIKYFKSERMGITGDKKNIPRVIVGADRETIRDLMVPWTEKRFGAMKDHYAQIQILRQILTQLNAFTHLAEAGGKDDIVKILKTNIALFEKIWEEKKRLYGAAAIREMERRASQDAVHQSLMAHTARIFA